MKPTRFPTLPNCLRRVKAASLRFAGVSAAIAALASTSQSLQASPQTLTLEPVALAHIRANAPDQNFPADNLWLNGNPSQMRSNLLVFELPSELETGSGRRVIRAELQLDKAASSGSISYRHIAALRGAVDGQGWDGNNPSPDAITWNNAPKNDPGSPGPVETGVRGIDSVRLRKDQANFDLTEYVQWALGARPDYGVVESAPDNRISLFLSTNLPVVYRYHGSGSARGPRLLLTFEDGDYADLNLRASPHSDGQQAKSASGGNSPPPAVKRNQAAVDDALAALVGDGEADDTRALQTLFGSGQTVRIPPGSYRVTDTLRASGGTRITGAGGSWNSAASGGTVIFYDGEPGGTLLEAQNAHFFQLRQVSLDGRNRADIGVYWNYSTQDALMEDVSILRTNEHALYITRTWYAHFVRLTVRNNNGRGVTLDRNHFKDLAAGPVNFVNFEQCQFSHSGKADRYDETTNIDDGYGFGSFGYNNMINVVACAIEKNGGPGIYITGHAGTMRFAGCYIEYNCDTNLRRDQQLHGNDARTQPNRASVGHQANIITDTHGRDALVFDTCYFHPYGGIWLKDQSGGRNPIEFRRNTSPTVVWAEHDDYIFESRWQPEFVDEAGVIYRGDDNKWRWTPGK